MRFTNENRWLGTVRREAARAGLPVWVVQATIAAESSFDPQAYVRVGNGHGLMQVTERTARRLGYRGPIGNTTTRTGGLFDPETSIRLGTQLLKNLRGRFPREPWDRIYSAYNSGRVDGAPEKHLRNWRDQADYFRPGWRTEPYGPDGADRAILIAGILAVGAAWLLLTRR